MDCRHRILFWNVQGAGSGKFLLHFQELVRINDPLIVVLVEPRISGNRADEVISSLNFSGNARAEASGFSGGIWVLWRKERINFQVLGASNQLLHAIFTCDGFGPCFFTAIYASHSHILRTELWDDLAAISDNIRLPWIVGGDFNDVRNLDERWGGSVKAIDRCFAFNNRISRCALDDLPFAGPKFTWRGKVRGRLIKSRIDRVLSNDEWNIHMPNAFVRHLARTHSDHNPILLCFGQATKHTRQKSFKFEASWLLNQNLKDVVRNNWFAEKDFPSTLARCAAGLTHWNNHDFGNIFKRKRRLQARLLGIQTAIDSGLPGNLARLEHKLLEEYNDVLLHEQVLWFQKSREEAATLQDRNTRFFHLSTINKRQKSVIRSLKDDRGNWISNNDQLKLLAVNYFRNLFTAIPGDQPRLASFFPPLSHLEWADLTKPVDKKEVRNAIFSMGPYKSPGPDGFQPVFFQKFWDVIGDDLHALVHSSFEDGHFPPALNETLLYLIPKQDTPSDITHFRPIGLCNVAYKTITKVISARIKPILARIIGLEQNSF